LEKYGGGFGLLQWGADTYGYQIAYHLVSGIRNSESPQVYSSAILYNSVGFPLSHVWPIIFDFSGSSGSILTIIIRRLDIDSDI
jgi:hypothetical protein